MATALSGHVFERPPEAPGRWLLLAWLGASLIEIIAPGLYWPHYYLLLVPTAAIVVGVALRSPSLSGTRRPWRWRVLVAAPIGMLLALFIAIQVRDYLGAEPRALTERYKGGRQWVTLRDLGRDLARRTASWSDPSLFIWGWQSPLYVYSKIDAPTRHAFTNNLMRDHAEGDHPIVGPRIDELMADLEASPPDLIFAGYPPFPDLLRILHQGYRPSRLVGAAPDGRGLWVRADRWADFEAPRGPGQPAARSGEGARVGGPLTAWDGHVDNARSGRRGPLHSPCRIECRRVTGVKANPVKAALRAGRPQVGTWLSLGSPFAARFLARTGLPWLTVDMEHGHADLQTAALMFGGIADAGCVPLARVPSCRHDQIKAVLDSGAMGIVVPMVMDADEARLAVSACLYPPRGTRSLGGSLHALNFGATAAEYFQRADEEILIVIQTEHIAAVERADEIYAVPGLDAVFVGPNDLAASLRDLEGRPPSKGRMEEVLQTILAAARRRGLPAGLHVQTVEDAQRRVEEGWQFLAVGSELKMMLEGAAEVAAAFGEGGAELARY